MQLPNILIEKFVERGQILHSNIFEGIGHSKFFVIIGITPEYIAGFFYVNSNINTNIIRSEEQRILQHKITSIDYDFLEHDSYICASNIKTIERSKLVESIQEGRTQIKCKLKDEDLQNLLLKLRASRIFNKKEKEDFFY